VPHPHAVMYDLVNDVAAYPQFLPWCSDARVLASDAHGMRASLHLTRGGVSKWFTTRNTLEPGRRIDIALEDGPFRCLDGSWSFEPLGDEGTKVALDMRFEFDGVLLDIALGNAMQEIFGSLLDAFVRRARERFDG